VTLTPHMCPFKNWFQGFVSSW